MLIHLAIPAFHAAVHQAAVSRLRDRPVAVAVDGGDQSPLFASSLEARAQGVWPGMRAAAARRRCPALAVVTPEPDWYRRAQAALAKLCNAYSPCVGARGGRLDVDLAGTERLWAARIGHPDQPLLQADAIAKELRRQAGSLGLRACLGVSHRLGLARLAARLARDSRGGVVALGSEREHALIDPLPLGWIADGSPELLRLCADCGIVRIGEARLLGAVRLRELAGEDAAPLIAVLTGVDEPVVPELVDPEPEIAVSCHGGDGGADPNRAALLIAGLARDLGFALRARNLACASIAFAGRHLDGAHAHAVHQADRQLRHDSEIAALALALMAKRARRVHWDRLTLSATRLCAAEEQLELFAPAREHRLECARDRLRSRFGSEIVQSMAG